MDQPKLLVLQDVSKTSSKLTDLGTLLESQHLNSLSFLMLWLWSSLWWQCSDSDGMKDSSRKIDSLRYQRPMTFLFSFHISLSRRKTTMETPTYWLSLWQLTLKTLLLKSSSKKMGYRSLTPKTYLKFLPSTMVSHSITQWSISRILSRRWRKLQFWEKRSDLILWTHMLMSSKFGIFTLRSLLSRSNIMRSKKVESSQEL